jgi:hypothetical protein
VLTDLVEECDPALVPHLPEVLDRTLLQPFTAHSAAVEHRLATLARRCSSPGTGPAAGHTGLSSASCPQERLWEGLPRGRVSICIKMTDWSSINFSFREITIILILTHPENPRRYIASRCMGAPCVVLSREGGCCGPRDLPVFPFPLCMRER